VLAAASVLTLLQLQLCAVLLLSPSTFGTAAASRTGPGQALKAAQYCAQPAIAAAEAETVLVVGTPGAAAAPFCRAFYNATDSMARFCAGRSWMLAHFPSWWCSGINDACLEAELARSGDGTVRPVCQPLPEGAPCGSKAFAQLHPTCRAGVCTDNKGQPVGKPPLPVAPVPSKPAVGGRSMVVEVPAQPTGEQTAFADVDVLKLERAVPVGFLGTSHEVRWLLIVWSCAGVAWEGGALTIAF